MHFSIGHVIPRYILMDELLILFQIIIPDYTNSRNGWHKGIKASSKVNYHMLGAKYTLTYIRWLCLREGWLKITDSPPSHGSCLVWNKIFAYQSFNQWIGCRFWLFLTGGSMKELVFGILLMAGIHRISTFMHYWSLYKWEVVQNFRNKNWEAL